MKKFFTTFFVVLGVIFFVLIIAGVVFFVTDPLNLKSLFQHSSTTSAAHSEEVQTDAHPALSDNQEKVLTTFGIDPASLPTELSAEQRACFASTLGSERVAEIQAGAMPTLSEYYAARDCL